MKTPSDPAWMSSANGSTRPGLFTRGTNERTRFVFALVKVFAAGEAFRPNTSSIDGNVSQIRSPPATYSSGTETTAVHIGGRHKRSLGRHGNPADWPAGSTRDQPGEVRSPQLTATSRTAAAIVRFGFGKFISRRASGCGEGISCLRLSGVSEIGRKGQTAGTRRHSREVTVTVFAVEVPNPFAARTDIDATAL